MAQEPRAGRATQRCRVEGAIPGEVGDSYREDLSLDGAEEPSKVNTETHTHTHPATYPYTYPARKSAKAREPATIGLRHGPSGGRIVCGGGACQRRIVSARLRSQTLTND